MRSSYRSLIADNARWDAFELRPSDIVISTPPKCGTTWTQMLCALLIFDGPDFPMPLNKMSVWVDQNIRSIADVCSLYAAQNHRRFIKTHTPLDGLPIRDDVTYLVVGRDPRDVMISMEHHLENMDMERVLALRGQAVGNDDLATLPARPLASGDPGERFRRFVTTTEHSGPANLTTVLHHLQTAWERRHDHNVVLCHYGDYLADLPGEITRLATALGYSITPERAVQFASEAGIDRMRANADQTAPNAQDIWRDHTAFFRTGSSGEWRERVTDDDLRAYDAVVRNITSPDLADWVHNGRLGSGINPES